jgi:hypothetical protein
MHGKRLAPGKSDNRTFEVALHFSGYGGSQELARARHSSSIFVYI